MMVLPRAPRAQARKIWVISKWKPEINSINSENCPQTSQFLPRSQNSIVSQKSENAWIHFRIHNHTPLLLTNGLRVDTASRKQQLDASRTHTSMHGAADDKYRFEKPWHAWNAPLRDIQPLVVEVSAVRFLIDCRLPTRQSSLWMQSMPSIDLLEQMHGTYQATNFR